MRTYEIARRVMTLAHSIRREAAARFNCRISEIHWGECLRMAWAEVRKPSTLDVIRSFTNSWTHPRSGEERLYLDEDKTAQFIGLEVVRYKSGSIKHATLDGEELSNSKANKIFFSMGRAYYDVASNTWHHPFGNRAVELIRAKLAA